MNPMLIAQLMKIGGGIAGRIASSGDRAEAERLRKLQLQEILELSAPGENQLQVNYDTIGYAGDLTPEMEAQSTLGPSAMEGVSADPALRDAEMEALLELQEIGQSGGMRLSDKAQAAEVMNDVNREAKGRRDATLDRFSARGLGGSGFELQAMLAGEQADANRISNEGLNTLGRAEDRALESLMSAGSMAGNISDRDFRQKSAVAEAKDLISKFNTSNRQSLNNRNTTRVNDARGRNIDTRQDLSVRNTGIRNRNQDVNRQAIQQAYTNRANLADRRAGAYGTAASGKDASAQATAEMFTGAGDAAGRGVDAYSDYDLRKRYGR